MIVEHAFRVGRFGRTGLSNRGVVTNSETKRTERRVYFFTIVSRPRSVRTRPPHRRILPPPIVHVRARSLSQTPKRWVIDANRGVASRIRARHAAEDPQPPSGCTLRVAALIFHRLVSSVLARRARRPGGPAFAHISPLVADPRGRGGVGGGGGGGKFQFIARRWE